MPKQKKSIEEKSALANFLIYLFSIVLSAAVILYLGYHFVNSFSSDLETEFAIQVTESDTIALDGYILRNETVVYASTTGGIASLQNDGTKVAVGSAIANIYSGTAPSVREDIINLDKKLELLEKSSVTDGLAASDTSVLDLRIQDSYLTIRQNAEAGVYSTLPQRRDDLLTLLNKRQIVTGVTEGYADVIASLETERALLTNTMDSISETVNAPVSGYFYSQPDGYEDIFTSSIASTLTFEQFDEIIAAEPKNVAANTVGKIATDFKWYVAAETDRDSLRFFNSGYYYTVAFPYNNDLQLDMKLINIVSSAGKNRVLLVFECSRIPEDFSFRRMQPIEVIRSSYTGYKVPISAVRLLDGEQGVYILVGNTVDFRKIDILLELDGYYIVAPQDIKNDPDYMSKLALYDVIITGGKNLYVGKMIS